MVENLYLRLSDAGVEWLLFDPSVEDVSARGHGDFETLAGFIATRQWDGEVIVLVSSSCVTLHNVNIPSKQPRQIQQAVPYAVEESLAADTDSCHFAISKRATNGDLSVAVISRVLLEGWLARLKELGIPASVMVVDALQIPCFPGQAQPRTTVLVESSSVIIRTGPHEGYYLDRSQLAAGIGFLDETEQVAVDLWIEAESLSALDLTLNQLIAEFETQIQTEAPEYPPFEFLCRNFSKDTINLLQGNYQVEKKSSGKTPIWKSAAVLAGCALLLHLIMTTGQAVYLDIKATQVEAETRALYAEIFPNDRNVTDLKRRWQSHLRGGNSDEGDKFVGLFGTAAGSLAGSNLVLNNVNFNESRGDLILQLEAPRSEQLVLFSQTLSKLGLDAEIGTISQEDNAVRGSIKVKSLGGD
jgi:general secretion pathway protein L